MDPQNNNTSPTEWTKRLKEAIAKDFAPLTKEETRKQGRQLIFMSFVSIIFSREILPIKSIDASGYAIDVANNHLTLTILLTGICIYLLLLYCIDLYGDWHSFPNEVYGLRNDLVQEHNTRMERYTYLATESDRLRQLRQTKTNEIKAIGKEEENRSETDDELEEFEKFIEKSTLKDQLWEELRKDGLDEIQNEMLELAFDKGIEERMAYWGKNVKRAYYLYRFRFWMEVVFPLTLCFFAMVSCILYLLNI